MKLWAILFISYIMNHSCQFVENNNLYETNGKADLYKGLYYAIVNKKSGLAISNLHKLAIFDIDNFDQWTIFNNDIHSIYYWEYRSGRLAISLEKITNGYYKLISESEETQVEYCYNCQDRLSDELQWKFIEMPDYRLTAVIDHFEYDKPQDLSKEFREKIQINEESETINYSGVEVSKKLSYNKIFNNSLEITFPNSIAKSWMNFDLITANTSTLVSPFGISRFTGIEPKFEINFKKAEAISDGIKTKSFSEISYSTNKNLYIPPYSKANVASYINWIKGASIPYRAFINIIGNAPRFLNNRNLDSNSMKTLLNKYEFNEKLITDTGFSLNFEIRGTFQLSCGLNSVDEIIFGKLWLNNSTLNSIIPQTVTSIISIKEINDNTTTSSPFNNQIIIFISIGVFTCVVVIVMLNILLKREGLCLGYCYANIYEKVRKNISSVFNNGRNTQVHTTQTRNNNRIISPNPYNLNSIFNIEESGSNNEEVNSVGHD